ncbi:hypothetical protein TYRP_000440 [Tyrophagus putrescentiae]|nr:hypothetical protein TYRP_000440 [Tyrophagus putrescentiae]
MCRLEKEQKYCRIRPVYCLDWGCTDGVTVAVVADVPFSRPLSSAMYVDTASLLASALSAPPPQRFHWFALIHPHYQSPLLAFHRRVRSKCGDRQQATIEVATDLGLLSRRTPRQGQSPIKEHFGRSADD